MDKILYNSIMHMIKKQCFYATGKAVSFDYTVDTWSISYKSKEKLFGGYKWVVFYHNIDYKSDIRKYEAVFKKLPKGISYSVKTKIEDETKTKIPTGKDDTATLKYKIIYTINVSDSYSYKVFSSIDSFKTLIDKSLSPEELKAVYEFKDIVTKNHSDFIKDIYSSNQPFNVIEVNTTNVLGKGFQISYSTYNLKNLNENYQQIGLALALANYSTKELTNNQFFIIYEDYDYYKTIFLEKREGKSVAKSNNLNDW